MATNSGQLDQISEAIGALRGELRGTKDIIVAHHIEADARWSKLDDHNDRIEAELRTVKHDARGVEMKVEGLHDGQKRLTEKIEPLEGLPKTVAAVDRRIEAVEVVNSRVEKLEKQVSRMDRMVLKASIYCGIASSLIAVLGTIALHFSAEIFHWFAGKS